EDGILRGLRCQRRGDGDLEAEGAAIRVGAILGNLHLSAGEREGDAGQSTGRERRTSRRDDLLLTGRHTSEEERQKKEAASPCARGDLIPLGGFAALHADSSITGVPLREGGPRSLHS